MVTTTTNIEDGPSSPTSRRPKIREPVNLSITTLESKTSKPPASRFSRNKPGTISTTDLKRGTQLEVGDKFQIELSTDADFCQQLLVDGFVQSFVDFFHLTNRADPNASEMSSASKIYTSLEDMIFIRDNLVQAEVSRRQGQTAEVYAAYNKLADLYASLLDWRTSIFFHEKCLEVAQLTGNTTNFDTNYYYFIVLKTIIILQKSRNSIIFKRSLLLFCSIL